MGFSKFVRRFRNGILGLDWGEVFVWLVVGVAIGLILSMLLTPARAHAQGGGYEVVAEQPANLPRPLHTRFWMPVIDATGSEIQILCGVAGYVMFSDGREPEYFILRIDDLVNIEWLVDPLNGYSEYLPGGATNGIPTEDLPPPTYFIFNPATLEQFDLHEPYL